MGMEVPTIGKTEIAKLENSESVDNSAEIQKTQNRIFDILQNPGADDQPFETLEIPRSWNPEIAQISDHDKFLALLSPQMKGKKILDIFCGHQPVKKYFQGKGNETEVIGVDLVAEEADIKSDVAEIEKAINPEKQFDFLLNFGGSSDETNYEILRNYLKENGVLISNSSGYIFKKEIAPVLSKLDEARRAIPNRDIVKRSSYFYPVAIVAVEPEEKDISNKNRPDYSYGVYIIWKKRQAPIFPNQEDIDRVNRREEIISKKRAEIDQIKDAQDEGIEEEMKDVVLAFALNDFPTIQSCQGHNAEIGRHGAPYIEIGSLNQPEWRFKNEKEIYQRIATKYGLTVEGIKRMENHEAWSEAQNEASDNEETEEYKAWDRNNQILVEKINNLLNEFYSDSEIKVDENCRLRVYEQAGRISLHNGGDDFDRDFETISETEKEAHWRRLMKYQREMNRFANFLLNKFRANFKE